jgi:Tfp pilus assembly protein PilP
LESHPDAGKLRAEIEKLQPLANQTAEIYPEHADLDDLGDQAKRAIRFLSRSRETIEYQADKYQAKRHDLPESVKKKIDAVCDQNAAVLRQSIDRMKAKLAGFDKTGGDSGHQ